MPPHASGTARRGAALIACLTALAAPAAAHGALGTPGSDLLRVKSVLGALLKGGGGGDRLVGGAGPDRLYGETGTDTLIGNGGDDLLDGATGGDTFDGGAGNDTGIGGFGHDTMRGGPGDDDLDGGPAPDKIDGGDGNDTLTAGSAGDVVIGGAGDDTIHSVSGPDVIDAGDGDDLVYVNTGNKVRDVDCGTGLDTVVINPYGMTGGPSNRRQLREGEIRNCERVIEQAPPVDPLKGIWEKVGSASGGSITGTDLNDRLFGLAGPDTLIGGLGDDELWGNYLPTGTGFGQDTLDGGPGDDTIFGGRVRNLIRGGAGDDRITNGIRENHLYAGPGHDEVILRGDGRGPNRVRLGSGDDDVQANSKGRAVIDCGPGRDTVTIGLNRRIRWKRNCERVTTRYKRR